MFANRTPCSIYWTKVQLALELHVRPCLLHLLHNKDNDPTYNGLPEDKATLFNYLDNWWKTAPKRVQNSFNPGQQDLLFPKSGLVDTSSWDITLIMAVIGKCIPKLIPPPGWKDAAVRDKSKGANACRARDFRNKIIHGGINNIATREKFEKLWKEMTDILTELGYNNMKEFQKLKLDSVFETYVDQIANAFDRHLKWLQEEYDTKLEDSIKKEIDAVKTVQSNFNIRLIKCGKFHFITSFLNSLFTLYIFL